MTDTDKGSLLLKDIIVLLGKLRNSILEDVKILDCIHICKNNLGSYSWSEIQIFKQIPSEFIYWMIRGTPDSLKSEDNILFLLEVSKHEIWDSDLMLRVLPWPYNLSCFQPLLLDPLRFQDLKRCISLLRELATLIFP